ncbi:hypothetical protein NUW58_g1337 [Xylaria curta]|uniref:Uncharacterized protein n=1 Tax=Xylaria curta TaxID=42375 RepID=A0ACC1PMG0_9PEZI|nr:hypothetical protein NUW58_g1337 [Xylaria curta]
MTGIISLPNELLFIVLAIGDGQLTCKQVASVARTCKALCKVAREQLYRYNILQDRSSVLIWAAMKNRFETINLALEFGADVNTVGPGWYINSNASQSQGTPLHYAAYKGYNDIVRLLLDHNARLDTHSEFICLCESNALPAPDAPDPPHKLPPTQMREESPNERVAGPTIVDCAAAVGLSAIVKQALNMYPSIVRRGKPGNLEATLIDAPMYLSPLFYAAECWNNRAVVQVLKAAGCDLDDGGYNVSIPPIWWACLVGNFALAMDLLAEGAQAPRWVDTHPRDPEREELCVSLLHHAVRGRECFQHRQRGAPTSKDNEQVAFAKALIEDHGHTVHDVCVHHTPLSAALSDSPPIDAVPAIVKLLLGHGADPNPAIDGMLSPISVAVWELIWDIDPDLAVRRSARPHVETFRDGFSKNRSKLPKDIPLVAIEPFWKASDEKIFEDAIPHSVDEDIDSEHGVNANPWQFQASGPSPSNAKTERSRSDRKHDAWEVVTELLKAGARIERQLDAWALFEQMGIDNVALDAAMGTPENHSYAILRLLLENGASKAVSSSYLGDVLKSCIELGPRAEHREAVSRLLVKHGASLDYQSRTLRERLEKRFLKHDDVWLAIFCYEKKCLLSPPGEIAMRALDHDRECVARYFLTKLGQSLATLRDPYTTALHIAVMRNDLELTSLLIDRGADVNALDFFKSSPLVRAVLSSSRTPNFEPDLRVTRLLLDNGADPFLGNHASDTESSECQCHIDPATRVRTRFYRDSFSQAFTFGEHQLMKCSSFLGWHQCSAAINLLAYILAKFVAIYAVGSTRNNRLKTLSGSRRHFLKQVQIRMDAGYAQSQS